MDKPWSPETAKPGQREKREHARDPAKPEREQRRPWSDRRQRADRRPRGDDDVQMLWGAHTVEAAVANPRRKLLRLVATENAFRKLEEAGLGGRITPEIMRPYDIDKLTGPDAVHQGLFLEARPLPVLDEDDVPTEGILVVLDQVTDPHNVGAVLRSAAAFGASGLVMTNRHSPSATGVLAKAASGALEYVPLVLVQNLSRALTRLKERGVHVVGLDSEAENSIEAIEMRRPMALVLGAEGKGLRQLTGETCSVLARFDLPGDIKSLNVSNAAVLALHVAARRTA